MKVTPTRGWPVPVARTLAVLCAVLCIEACSVSSLTRYPVSPENNLVLKRYAGAKVRMGDIKADFDYDVRCRYAGGIEGPEGSTIPQFIARSFNDEFKLAGLYSETGAQLVGEVTHLDFSSTAKAGTKGYWDIAMKVRSKVGGGESIPVQTRYEFNTGILNTDIACSNAAQALMPAVQDLILRTVSDPEFAKLIR